MALRNVGWTDGRTSGSMWIEVRVAEDVMSPVDWARSFRMAQEAEPALTPDGFEETHAADEGCVIGTVAEAIRLGLTLLPSGATRC